MLYDEASDCFVLVRMKNIQKCLIFCVIRSIM